MNEELILKNHKYKFTHEKVYLVTIIAGGIASIASLISFILVSVR